MIGWIRYRLWDIWIPDYEGGGPWHLRWRAALMARVRGLWYRGATRPCICYGCPEDVTKASASGLCRSCLSEDCQHEPADECATCSQPPSIFEVDGAWFAGCGCREVAVPNSDFAVEKWNALQESARRSGEPST
jgi:hypothetical protein